MKGVEEENILTVGGAASPVHQSLLILPWSPLTVPLIPNKVKITERTLAASTNLDKKPTRQILGIINREDSKVARAVARTLPQIARGVDLIVEALHEGGRLVYLGAGTSGRLGVLDAAECIPTFGTDRVIGVLAGGSTAMSRPTEASEDHPTQAMRDLRRVKLCTRDVLVVISASGYTPYALGGLRYARRLGAATIAVTCNPRSPICHGANVAIIPIVGPEVIAGSTRMKAGTAQKLVLNMLSTASMVRWGRVVSNWMINVQARNRKLRRRAAAILANAAGVSAARAERTLGETGFDLPTALLMLWKEISRADASRLLANTQNSAALLRAEWAKWRQRSGRGPLPAKSKRKKP
ncbi:MAG: N-acetylmuramic acid 6-phosphate etherase [Terriglobia bacterium]